MIAVSSLKQAILNYLDNIPTIVFVSQDSIAFLFSIFTSGVFNLTFSFVMYS